MDIYIQPLICTDQRGNMGVFCLLGSEPNVGGVQGKPKGKPSTSRGRLIGFGAPNMVVLTVSLTTKARGPG